MDVHRSRFVPYPASAISVLAFSRSSDSGYTGSLPALKLAIGRANGNIEIWNPQKGLWVQEAILLGNNISIDALAWTQDADEKDAEGHILPGQQRLFSIASSAAVTEWNLATGQPKRRSTGNFSEVWCFAAQPRWKLQKNSEEEAQSQELIAGCGDGTIVLLSTTDDDLQFKRFLARVSGKKARCMCITYQTRDRVVAGFADSIIRIYDTRSGSLLRTMSLGVSIPGSPKSALVWQVRCLPNGDIVSGDSNGEVKFWDGRTYSLVQRISGHESDCLDLIVSSDGRTVMSGSIDGRMAIYRQSTGDQGRKSWARSSHRRVHSGEVKAMAAFDSKGMSVVVSGGSDVTPMVQPLREYGKENLRALPALPQEPPVASAPKARLVASWWEKSVYIWRIAKQSSVDSVPEPRRPRKLVARIGLDTKDNIQSASLASDGRLLAAATNAKVKVFQLRKRVEVDALAVRKLASPGDFTTLGAHVIEFSPDGKWLAGATPEGEVHVVRITHDIERPKHLQVLSKAVELERQHRSVQSNSAFKAYERTVNRLTFAPDSSVLVAADRAGYLDSWILEGHEDLTAPAIDIAKHESKGGSSDAGSDSGSSSDSSDDEDSNIIFFGQHWTDNPAGHLPPKLDSQPLVLTFRPSRSRQDRQSMVNGNPGIHSTRNNPHAHSHELPRGEHRLWILTAKHQMFEFDILAGRLSDWSRRNPTAVLPDDFSKIRDRVMGAVWDVDPQRERLWLYGSSFVCMLNVGMDLADGGHPRALTKRRRKPKGDSEGYESDRKRRKLESGAGGKVDSSLKNGAPEVVKRHEENGALTKVELNGQRKPTQDSDDDDEDDERMDLELTRIRSGGNESDAPNTVAQPTGERQWWCTFKYRPILGMAPLEDASDAADGAPLEVVLIERPVWEVQNQSS
ncbi:U3 small nucleolar RNA-associated protein [Vermiconidia calcicola]|uniref:U3 small nucleolar RNA-associated protein n=1 Tax=Vermiconidia calcicola TaxID=1690605 RepID=A0ACC3MFU0_9PEZI|nr:U3 small nucleolar RNA-associated protein [Vermiconidia calcicola]